MRAGDAGEAAAERRRHGRFKVALAGIVLGATALAGGVVLVDGVGTQQTWGLILTVVGVTVAAASVVLAWRRRPGEAAQRQAAPVGRRDREQQARRASLWMIPWVMAMGLVFVTPAVWRAVAGTGSFGDWLWAACGLVYAWVAPAMVMGWDGGSRKLKRFLEDELTDALRARAMTTGFVVLLAATGGVYVLGLWRPEAAITAMPAALASGGLAAALRFALLDRAADAGDDG